MSRRQQLCDSEGCGTDLSTAEQHADTMHMCSTVSFRVAIIIIYEYYYCMCTAKERAETGVALSTRKTRAANAMPSHANEHQLGG